MNVPILLEKLISIHENFFINLPSTEHYWIDYFYYCDGIFFDAQHIYVPKKNLLSYQSTCYLFLHNEFHYKFIYGNVHVPLIIQYVNKNFKRFVKIYYLHYSLEACHPCSEPKISVISYVLPQFA